MLVDGTLSLSPFAGEMLELFSDAALIVSREGSVIRANRHARALMASRACAGNASDAWHHPFDLLRLPEGGNVPDWPSELDRLAGKDSASLTVTDGLGRHFRVHAVRWHDDDDGALGWCVRIAEEAVRLSADWDRLRVLAHDLRAPQSSTLALLALQQEADTAVTHEEFLQRIEMACRKTLRLTDGYMELIRAESQPIEREESDFAQIVMDAVDEIWEVAQANRVYLVADLPEVGFPVRGDHALLVRALVHLLSNAVRHSPLGSRVECSLTLTAIAGASFIRCTVSDHGPGIAPADQARLFESFAHIGHAQEMLANPGAGLGLAFVQAVARRHGGFVQVASSPGDGATFGLTLPMGEAG